MATGDEEFRAKLIMLTHRFRQQQADDPSLSLDQFVEDCPEYAAELRRILDDQSPADPPVHPYDASTTPYNPNSDVVLATPELPSHVGRYEVERQLGAGTYGVVYLCYDSRARRKVAIKVPHLVTDESYTRAMQHEAEVAAQLSDDSIARLHDIATLEDGRDYLVYEFVPGKTLQQRLQNRDYTMLDAVRWCKEIALGLAYAHQRGVVHRDIKPSNLLIDDQDRAKILDFGLAKLNDKFYDDDTGTVLGTTLYMSPEQASGHSEWAAPAADVYSLSVVLYQLLTGKLPFQANDATKLLQQIREREPAAPRTTNPEIPRELEAICLRGLQKRPGARFATAADMAAELDEILTASDKPDTAPTVGRAAIAAGLVLVAGLLLVRAVPDRAASSAGDVEAASALLSNPRWDVAASPSVSVWRGADENAKPIESLGTLRPDDHVRIELIAGDSQRVDLFWFDTTGTWEKIELKSSELGNDRSVYAWPSPDSSGNLVGPYGTEVVVFCLGPRGESVPSPQQSDPLPELTQAVAFNTTTIGLSQNRGAGGDRTSRAPSDRVVREKIDALRAQLLEHYQLVAGVAFSRLDLEQGE